VFKLEALVGQSANATTMMCPRACKLRLTRRGMNPLDHCRFTTVSHVCDTTFRVAHVRDLSMTALAYASLASSPVS
jgi:hypothetical protein